MSVVQKSPWLFRQRTFPRDNLQALSIEIDKAYVDIATRVNDRTIGLYSINLPSITGNRWFLQGSSNVQPTLREVYSFTAAGSYPHGIDTAQIGGFVLITGTVEDASGNWYPLPLVVASGSVNNQIALSVTPTNIVITAGSGSPAIAQIYVILEWLSQSTVAA
jgi:hypothetical protein